MRLPHINNPLSPIWLILHIDSVLGQRVCSDLEPSFNVKCEVHSWSLGHKLFPIGQILLKLNPQTDPRKTYKSISIRFTRFNKTPQTYWGRGGFPSKMKGCGVGWIKKSHSSVQYLCYMYYDNRYLDPHSIFNWNETLK